MADPMLPPMLLVKIAAGVATVVGAAWLHEFTHLFAAWAVGCDEPEIDFLQLQVTANPPTQLASRVILAAPSVVGLVTCVPVLWWCARQSDVLLVGVVVTSWVVFTLGGGSRGELSLLADRALGIRP